MYSSRSFSSTFQVRALGILVLLAGFLLGQLAFTSPSTKASIGFNSPKLESGTQMPEERAVKNYNPMANCGSNFLQGQGLCLRTPLVGEPSGSLNGVAFVPPNLDPLHPRPGKVYVLNSIINDVYPGALVHVVNAETNQKIGTDIRLESAFPSSPAHHQYLAFDIIYNGKLSDPKVYVVSTGPDVPTYFFVIDCTTDSVSSVLELPNNIGNLKKFISADENTASIIAGGNSTNICEVHLDFNTNTGTVDVLPKPNGLFVSGIVGAVKYNEKYYLSTGSNHLRVIKDGFLDTISIPLNQPSGFQAGKLVATNGKLYVGSPRSGNNSTIAVLNFSDNSVSTISGVGSSPAEMVVNSAQTKLFVGTNTFDSRTEQLTIVDLATNTVECSHLLTKPCPNELSNPKATGIAFYPAKNTIYVCSAPFETLSIFDFYQQFAVTGGGVICAGSNNPGLPIGLAGSQTGFSYQLQLNGSNTGSPLAGTGGALNFGNFTAPGTYKVVATKLPNVFSFDMANTVTIVVNTPPSATITAPSQVSAGSIGNIASVPSAGTGATYNWTITNGSITSSQPYTNQIYFTAGAVGTIQLSVTVTAGGCSASGGPFSIDVIYQPQAGRLFVADTGHNLVKKYENGTWTDLVSFTQPKAVTADPTGQNIFVTRTGSLPRVFHSTDGGSTWFLLGNPLMFNAPQGLALSADGYVFVSDANRVLCFSPAGAAAPGGTPLWVLQDDREIGAFQSPRGLAVIGDSLFIADSGNRRIVRVDRAGSAEPSAPFVVYQNEKGSFTPEGLGVDNGGNLYVTDTSTENGAVWELIGAAGGLMRICVCSGNQQPISLSHPEGVTVCSGELFGGGPGSSAIIVSDTGNNQLLYRIVPSGGSPGPFQPLLGTTFSSPGKIR